MVAPGYRCYYARQVRLRRYDRNIAWDLTPWWDALSESAKRLYEDEEEGRIYFDAAGKARNAITLYYHHHRALAGMESTPALWRAIRLNWEMEPQDVRAYWEGLLFVGSPDVVSAQGAPTLSTSSQGFHMGTSIEPYYRKVTSAAARAPQASTLGSTGLSGADDQYETAFRGTVAAPTTKDSTNGEIEALAAFFSVHGDEFKSMMVNS